MMNDVFTKTELALMEALERERALLRQRDLVNGIILHEMANAITIVVGGAELIGQPPPSLRFAVDRMKAGAFSMREMLAGLRVLIGDDSALPVFEESDLSAFVRSVVTDPVLTAETAARRVFVMSRLRTFRHTFCPALLRHVLANLVRNALRYSPDPLPVSVLLSERGGQVWIHVLNRGPKIAPEVAEAIFEPRKKSVHGGMGFGLHIAQACALRSGGDLVFGSTVRATVFSVLLRSGAGLGAAYDERFREMPRQSA